jgi:hypothetical protein
VQYVTLVQHAEGLILERVPQLRSILANILVLSAGGNGHVPVPLLSKPVGLAATREANHDAAAVPPLAPPAATPAARAAAARESSVETPGELDLPSSYPYLLAFAGQMNGAVRPPLVDAVASSRFKDRFLTFYAPNDTWIGALRSAAFALAPSGTGRTSFRLYEALQLGLVPVYVYADVPWLPYRRACAAAGSALSGGASGAVTSIWDDIALVFGLREFEAWLLRKAESSGSSSLRTASRGAPGQDAQAVSLATLAFEEAVSDARAHEYMRMKARIRELVPRYFTYHAVMRHIRSFFEDPATAELACVQKPLPMV